MKIQRGIVKYKDRNDIVCTYALTDDGKQYYFLDETDTKKFSNGNRIASTALVEAVDPMVKASNVGVIDQNGVVVIPFENRSIRPVNDNVIVIEKAEPTSQSVIDANNLRNDPTAAAKLVSTPATIKDRINAQMGTEGKYIFNDQFSEATVCDINGTNLVGGESYSFISMANDKLYLAKNEAETQISEFSLTTYELVAAPVTNTIDVAAATVDQQVVEGALNNTQVVDGVVPVADAPVDGVGEVLVDAVQPAEGVVPVDGEVPVDAAQPVDGVVPGEVPVDGVQPVDGVVPVAGEVATDGLFPNADDAFVPVDGVTAEALAAATVDGVDLTENKEEPKENVNSDVVVEDTNTSDDNTDTNNDEDEVITTTEESKEEKDGTEVKTEENVVAAPAEKTEEDINNMINTLNTYTATMPVEDEVVAENTDNFVVNYDDESSKDGDDLPPLVEEDTNNDEEVEDKTNEENEEAFSNIITDDDEEKEEVKDEVEEKTRPITIDAETVLATVDRNNNGIIDSDEIMVPQKDNKDTLLTDIFNEKPVAKEEDTFTSTFTSPFEDNTSYTSNFDSILDDVKTDTMSYGNSYAGNNIMADVAKSMTGLMKQNKDQKNKITQYESQIETLESQARMLAEKYKDQSMKFETIANRLQSKNQMLESRVRDQEKIIASQDRELKSLRPQVQGNQDLMRILADAQNMLGSDTYGYDDGSSYYRRAA